ncbi:hypothetical protein F4823DRAFT_629716 [Ustulina deusta]|nr:hypothetical protein F4823DRAFT_629716 [Ustulina deusta]
MTTVDYSKWDNIDTDSEPEISLPSAPTPQAPTPEAPQPGAQATAAPVTSSTPGSIQAVMVRCDVKRKRFLPWSATMIRADHPVFSNFVPSVPGLIEIPLVLHRQSYVGTVLVARKDGKPLLPQHLEGVWMYCDYILDLFGEGGEQKELRPGTGGKNDPDDWRVVRAPYEM